MPLNHSQRPELTPEEIVANLNRLKVGKVATLTVHPKGCMESIARVRVIRLFIKTKKDNNRQPVKHIMVELIVLEVRSAKGDGKPVIPGMNVTLSYNAIKRNI